jgi:hypothetical protein
MIVLQTLVLDNQVHVLALKDTTIIMMLNVLIVMLPVRLALALRLTVHHAGQLLDGRMAIPASAARAIMKT